MNSSPSFLFQDSERSLRSKLREAEQSLLHLEADLVRQQSSRTPTAGLPPPFSSHASGPSWSHYAPQTPANGYAPSSVGSPSAVVHRLQQQVLTPPGSNFRHAPLRSIHSSWDAGYFSTPTKVGGGGGGGGPGMGKGASGSMHAPMPSRAGTVQAGRGPSATPISRVGTVKPPESEDGWWGED